MSYLLQQIKIVAMLIILIAKALLCLKYNFIGLSEFDTTTEVEDFLNPYTDYGENSQTRYGYGYNDRRRNKGSTTHITNGQTPAYDVVVNGRDSGYPKGKCRKWCISKVIYI